MEELTPKELARKKRREHSIRAGKLGAAKVAEKKAAEKRRKDKERKKTRCRKFHNRNRQYLPYEDAQRLVQYYKIDDRDHYREWIKTAGHRGGLLEALPMRPDNVYTSTGHWESWPAFLGRESRRTYENIQRVWRYRKWLAQVRRNKKENKSPFENLTYEETIKEVHKHKFSSADKYRVWARENNYPYHPNKVWADQWEDWFVFLGKDLEAKIEVARDDFSYMALIYQQGYPLNVFHFVEEHESLRRLKERLDDDVMIGRVWRLEKGLRERFREFISRHTRPYQGESMARIVHSVHELVADADEMFERVERVRINQHL